MKSVINIASLLLLCLTAGNIYGQSLFIEKSDTGNYPETKFSFIYLNDKSEVEYPKKSNLEFWENGVNVQNYTLNTPNEIERRSVDFIFAFNISESISKTALSLAKASALKIASYLETHKNNSAVISYNNLTFLNQGFTNNVQKIVTAIENINETFGSGNIETAFYEPITGIFSQAENTVKPLSVLLFTNSHELGDIQKIIADAQEKNIQINVFVFREKISSKLKSISEETDGIYFDNVVNREISKRQAAMLFHRFSLKDKQEITYISNSCDNRKDIALVSRKDTDLGEVSIFYIDEDKLSGIRYPNGNIINFGISPKGALSTKKISVKSHADSTLITNVTTNNNDFTVLTNFPIQVAKDSIFEIEVQHLSQGERANRATFFIESDLCRNDNFFAMAGNSDYPPKDSFIEIYTPDNSRTYLVGEDMDIRWNGNYSAERIDVSYSYDAGKSWTLIVSDTNATNYTWENIPDSESDSCLMKVEQLSQNRDASNIITFDVDGDIIVRIQYLEKRNAIITASVNGDIDMWDLKTGGDINNIASGIDGLNGLLTFPDNDTLVAYSYNSPDVKVINVNNFQTEYILKGIGENISTLSRNTANDKILAGTVDGTILLWNYKTAEAIDTVNAHAEAIENLIFNQIGDRYASSAGSKVKIWHTSTGTNTINMEKFQYSVNSLSYSPDGQKLAVTLKNKETKIWNVVTNKQISSLANPKNPLCISVFSPESNMIAESGNDARVNLWNLETNTKFYSFNFHDKNICEIQWFRDIYGMLYLATGDNKGYVKCWKFDDIPFENGVLHSDISDEYWKIEKKRAELEEIDFGEIALNKEVTIDAPLFFTNKTSVAISIDSVKIIDNDDNIFGCYIQKSGEEIATQKQVLGEFYFIPKEINDYSATIQVYSGRTVFESEIRGRGKAPDLDIQPKFIDFGTVNVGQSKTDSIEIFNNSEKDISIEFNTFTSANIDEFTKDTPDSFIIPHNGSKVLRIAFAPQDGATYNQSLKIESDANNSPNIVQLFGIGSESDLRYENSLYMDDMICDKQPVIGSIIIQNLGDKNIIIEDINLEGNTDNAFSLGQVAPLNIDANKELIIDVVFSTSQSGTYNSKLVFKTNEPGDHNVFLHATRGHYDLQIEPELIDFMVSNDETAEKKILITNTGTLAYEFDFPYSYKYFFIEADKNIINPNEKIDAKIFFKGYSEDTTITQIHEFIDNCGIKNNVEIKAVVGEKSANVDVISQFYVSDLKCGINTKDTAIIMKNKGMQALKINSVNIADTDNFEIISYPDEIDVNSIDTLIIRFKPNDFGEYHSKINIESNASNYEEGKILIDIFANYYDNKFELSTDTLRFKNILENTSAQKEFTISNFGNYEMEYILSRTKIFQLSKNDIAINKNNSKKIIVTFPGGTADQEYIETVKIIDECGLTKELMIIAEIAKYPQAVFSISKDISAPPGMLIDVPILLTSPYYPALPEVESYDVVISTNATILFEQTGHNLGLKNGRNLYKFNGLVANPNDNGIVYTMKFMTALGNSDSTEIRIESVTPIGSDVITAVENGLFNLEDVCENSGLISRQGVILLFQNNPNPAKSETEINFSILEEGEYSLELYNSKGKLLEVIRNEMAIPGDYNAKLETGKYASGAYYYVLRTYSQTRIRKMLIVH